MDEINESLKSLGLEDKEARIYIALLKLGQSSVGDIADEALIKRPTAYVVLDQLRKKGLVLKMPHAKRTIFEAKTPDEFFAQSVSNINQFEKILPRLRSMNPSKKGIKTLYFEGINGLKEAMYYRFGDLKNSTESGFFAKNDGSIPKKLLDMFINWNKDREESKIKVNGITPNHPSTIEFHKNYSDPLSDYVFAPLEDYSSDVSIEITEEFIRIVDGHELKAIIIENPRVADAFRQIFKIARDKYIK